MLVTQAHFGLVKVDLQDQPILELTWGNWNPQNINRGNFNKMVVDFVNGTCQPWYSPLVIIASKSDFVDK